MPVSWHKIPRIQVASIPIRIAPLTFLIYRIAMRNVPIIASNAEIPEVEKLSVKLTIETRVDSLFTVIPAF